MSATRNLVTYHRSKYILPPRYRTRFEMDVNFYATSGRAGLSTYFNLNGMFQPFNGTLSGTNVPVIVNSGAWNLGTGFLITSMPQGYSNLLASGTIANNPAAYNAYRVYGTKVMLTATSASSSDTGITVLCPFIGVNWPSSSQAAMADPLAITGVFSSAMPRRTTISKYFAINELLGVSKRAIQDDVSGSFDSYANANPTVNPMYMHVSWFTADGTNLVNNLGFRIRIIYYAELFSPLGTKFTTT